MARTRKTAHNRRPERALPMADKVETFGEVSIALQGVNSRLSLMTGVFAGSVAIGVSAFLWLASEVRDLGKNVARLEGGLTTAMERIDDRLRRLEERLPERRSEAPVQPVRPSLAAIGEPNPASFGGWIGFNAASDKDKASALVSGATNAAPAWVYVPFPPAGQVNRPR